MTPMEQHYHDILIAEDKIKRAKRDERYAQIDEFYARMIAKRMNSE